MNLTKLEKQVMLAYNHFRNYSSALDEIADNAMLADVRLLSIESGLPQKTVRGTLGSLTKKGLVFPDDDTPDGTPGQWITEEGIHVLYRLIEETEQNASAETQEADNLPQSAPAPG